MKLIYKYYKSLTTGRIAKYRGNTVKVNILFVLCKLSYSVAILFAFINLFQYFFQEYAYLMYSVIILCLIIGICFMYKSRCRGFVYIVDDKKQILNIDKYREGMMYRFLVKEGYINNKTKNTYFYSVVISFISAQVYKPKINNATIISVASIIISLNFFVFGVVEELGHRILLGNIVLLLLLLILGYYNLVILTNKNDRRWRELYSIFLNLRFIDAAGKYKEYYK